MFSGYFFILLTMTSPTAASPSLTTRRRSVTLTTFTVCCHGVCDVSRHDVGREASDTSGSSRHLSASCASENISGNYFYVLWLLDTSLNGKAILNTFSQNVEGSDLFLLLIVKSDYYIFLLDCCYGTHR